MANKTKEGEYLLLSKRQCEILEYLIRRGDSYPSKMSKKEEMNVNAANISENFRLLEEKYPELLEIVKKRKPEQEINRRNKATYYRIKNLELAKNLIKQFQVYEKQKPAQRKSRRVNFLFVSDKFIIFLQ